MATPTQHSDAMISRRGTGWRFVVVGLNHKTASNAVRASLQIGREEIAKFEARLFVRAGVLESAVVATCNRIEFYLVCDRAVDPFDVIADLYRDLRDKEIHHLEPHCYRYEEREATEHLFRVAAGIDSMVLGENQILGQLKDAYSSACQLKTAGKVLQRAFHQAFRVGKRARTDTSLGRGACSISSAAVEMIASRIEEAAKPAVLFIGAGKMISLAASRMTALPVASMTFVNRTEERAEALAEAFGGKSRSWKELTEAVVSADIAVSCTGSSDFVVTSTMLSDIAKARPHDYLLLVDLAMPPDIDSQAGRWENIDCLTLDDIQEYTERNRSDRVAEIPAVEQIIQQRLDEFMYWYTHVHREISLGSLRESLETIRREEMRRVIAKLPLELQSEFTDASRHLVEKLMQVHLRVQPTADKGA